MIVIEILVYTACGALAFGLLMAFVKLFGKKPDGDEV